MNPFILQKLHSNFSVSFLFVLLANQVLSEYLRFELCAPKTCGTGPSISYPFYINEVQEPFCGYPNFGITCASDYPILTISYDEYIIKDIFYDNHSLLVATSAAYEDACPLPMHNVSLDRTPFNISPGYINFSFLYNCSSKPSAPELLLYPISCSSNETSFSFAGFHIDALNSKDNHLLESSCQEVVESPVYTGGDVGKIMEENYTEILKMGFFLNWTAPNCSTCQRSGGRCGFENNEFACFCKEGSNRQSCHVRKSLAVTKKVIIGVVFGGIGIVAACIIFCCFRLKKDPSITSRSFFKSITKNNYDREAFMRDYGSLVPKRYSFREVQRISNMFKNKLGQGGYGSVYKGKLPNGGLVAVKILNESRGNGEEFINEVASISRTSHVNVVSLVGFCLERRKRALLYEFMPNGSLEKFLGNQHGLKPGEQLDWEKLYQIAVGVARGLEYLHRGCNTRIVHFDIKPHNILLDEDFCPKISDFGLAKISTKKESILSMLEARGTIGYIAPEVFSRNFGGVSHKSDVYSYGMMLLEMVGERSKDDSRASDTTEKYFPYWVYKHVEQNEFNVHGVLATEENVIVRKMAIVGLWCIQTNPSDRPSMSKVIEMLVGSSEVLNIPPKPFLSPPRSATACSSTMSTT